ncbi:MAG: glycosyltransferase, partial [Chthoniobacteraceae bacterium]
GLGNAASGSVAGRGGDWDLFHKAPKEIGWRKRLAKVPDGRLPVISVVMPVYRTPLALLERTVLSVITQEYPKWELCIADDGSGDESLREWLESRARGDSRIKLTISDHNRGISAATNAALALCTGDFVALLDHDDELTPDALGEVAGVLAEHPETDAVYSDQDKMDGSGRRYQPFHKPAWSPVFFLGVMYVGHLLVIRRDVMETVGGCDTRFDKVQDYELMLRVSEVTDRIRHIPKILYHWRAITGSVAASHSAKGSIEELQAAAVAAHLRRRKIAAEAVSHPRHAHRVLLEPATDQPQPAISIIIPTAGDSPTLGVCLASIVEKTTYAEYEILLVVRKDPNRTDVQNRNLAAARGIARVRVLEYDFPFNYSRVNNFAADVACGTMLVFLNDDTSVITHGWLESMATHLSLPRVGAVGPRLLYPDGSVQHAGVVLGFRGTADHVMRGFPCDADGYFGSLCVSREVSAVTGACLMTRADTFRSVGGMRECYASVYQDVDLCLRIRQSGHSIIYVANVELVHHESTTRGSGYDRVDREILIDRWREELAADPCYNANFTRNRHDYTLKWAQS